MISQTRPKLLLFSLIFFVALLPFGQNMAAEMGSMDTMVDACTGCEMDSKNSETVCDVDNNCLQSNCVSSFTQHTTGFISIYAYIDTRLILELDANVESMFQSRPPESLYRPPIA